MFSETVISHIFSTVFCRSNRAADSATRDNVTLSDVVRVDVESRCRFVEASVFCCCGDGLPSMARKMYDPNIVYPNKITQIIKLTSKLFQNDWAFGPIHPQHRFDALSLSLLSFVVLDKFNVFGGSHDFIVPAPLLCCLDASG